MPMRRWAKFGPGTINAGHRQKGTNQPLPERARSLGHAHRTSPKPWAGHVSVGAGQALACSRAAPCVLEQQPKKEARKREDARRI